MNPALPPPDGPACSSGTRFPSSDPAPTRPVRFARSAAFGQRVFGSVRSGASFRCLLVLCFVGWCGLLRAAAQDKADLSVSQTVSHKTPALGDTLTYTVTVRNAGPAAADSVEVTGWLPDGVAYVDATVLRGAKAWQHDNGTGLWKLGTLAAGDSALVRVRAKVTQPGVWFSVAFVSKQKQPDADSTPGNESLLEDDYATACFTVPVALFPDEELTVKIPTGYRGIVWFRNDAPISANTPDDVAVVNADSSLTIRAPGTYRFTVSLGDCPAGGCCPVVVVAGQYRGTIGGLVWKDLNGDGIRASEPDGIAGATVRLLDSTGTKVQKSLLTNAEGRYRFDSLAPGKYRVEFAKPDGFSAVRAHATADSTKDSDADSTSGRTKVLVLGKDASLAHVDAGFLPPLPPPCAPPVVAATLATQAICQGDTASLKTYALTVTGPTDGLSYQWYAASATKGVLGAALAGATLPTFRPTAAQLPAANGTEQFYAVVVRRNGSAACADTAWVGLTVKPRLAAPALAAVPLTCAGDSVSLTATSAGHQIRWYASANATTPLATTGSGRAFRVRADSSVTYYAEAVADGSCASPRAAAFVGVNPRPKKPTGLTALANACPDSTVNLAAALRRLTPSVPGGTFEWHLGPLNSSALVVDSLGTKTLTLYLFEKSPEGCYSDPQAVTVTITKCGCAIPVAVTLTAPSAVCGLGPIAASAKVDAGNLALSGTWSSTGSGLFSTVNGLSTQYTPSKADSTAGTVTLTFTTLDPDGSGVCQAVSQSSVVKLNVLPSLLAVRADTTLCRGDSLLLTATASAGASVKWYSAAANGTLLGTGNLRVKPTQTTTYYAEASGSACTNPERRAVRVAVTTCVQPIDLSLVKTVTPANVFVGDTVAYTLEIQNAGPGVATNVQVRDALPAGLKALSWPGMTKVADTLTASFASLPANGVQKFTFTAKVTGEGTITNRAQITAAGEPDADSTPNNGTANGEDDQASATVKATKPCLAKVPELSAPKTAVATNECVTLTATGCDNGTVTWTAEGQPTKTGLTLQICPAATVTYTATCTVDGCTSLPSKPLLITVYSTEAPVVKASAKAVCNSPVTLTATGCATGTLVWSHDPTAKGDSLVVTLAKTTTFTAVCKTADYTSPTSNAVTVEVAKPMIPVIGAISTEICPGGSTVLAAYGCDNGTVVWSDGQQGLTVTVSPEKSTNYFAQCKLGDCTSEKSNVLTINVMPGVTPTVSASATSLCYGATITLTAVGCSGGVQWSNGLTGLRIEVNKPGSYAAKCVGTGCSGEFSKPVVIKEGDAPAAPKLLASQKVICPGESVTLTASGCEKGLVAWNTGKTGPSLTVSLTETAVFTATCTLNSCTSAPSVADTVRVNSPTTPGIAASKTTIQAGESVTLSATGCNGTLHWNNGMTGLQITVKPRVDTTYWATCRVGTCESPKSNEIKITVKCAEPPAKPVLSATKTTVLRGTGTVLTAKGCDNGTVSWKTTDNRPFDPARGVGGKLSGANQQTLSVTPPATTTYLATCTVDGCTSAASDSLTIAVEDCADLKAPIVVASSKLVCAGTPVTLSVAGCDNGRLLWNTGDTTRTLVVKPTLTSTYSAQCRVGNCTSPISNDETVSVVTPLVPTVTADSMRIDSGGTATLTARGCNGTVIWSNGGIGASITVKLTADSTFTARCVVGQCTGEASKPVTIKVGPEAPTCPTPEISASKTTVCAGTSVTLTATGCTGTVIWNGTYAGASYTLSLTQTTTFRATCNQDGCVSPASDSLVVTVETVPAPVRSAAPLTNVCPATTVNLTAAVEKPASGTVEFYTGTTIGSPKVAKPDSATAGTYYAFVKSESGCYGAPLELVAGVTTCDTAKKVLSLGIAKQVVGTPTQLADKVFAITYEFRAKNLGTVGFEKLRLRDDLKAAFAAKGAVVDSLTLTADAGLTVNPAYTGEGAHTDLLIDSLSTLPAGVTRWVRLTVRVNTSAATDSVFNNTAVGKGWANDGSALEDASTVGIDPDPDNDDDPNNNNVPTPVTLRLEATPLQATIGLAMHADTVRQADGAYRVIYTLTLRNFGDQTASRVQVTDSLSQVFTGAASFAVVDQPGGLAEGSPLTPNPNFDGKTDANLLIAERSSLPARQTETFRFTVLVTPDGRTEPFLNTALATARYGDVEDVFDYSTNGFNPAPNGVPALAFEPTPVTLPVSDDGRVFIPEGFSPNGDGVNDVFRIRNTAGATVNLQIFNRWGQLVFGSEEYKNDWDGTSNRGSAFNNKGLPDGTYYYVVKLSDGRQFARYLTLMR